VRLVALASLCLLTVCALASCGKGNLETVVTRAQASAFAAEVNLRRGDLNGISPSGSEREAQLVPGSSCSTSRLAARPLVDRLSPRFGAAGAEVASYVAVYRNAALAAREGHVDPARVEACTARALSRTAFRCSETETSTGRVPRTAEPFAMRVVCVRVSAARGHGEFVEDTATFRVGAAVIGLSAVGRRAPVPLALERELLAKLYHRAASKQL